MKLPGLSWQAVLFTVFGIAVAVDISLFIVILLISWTMASSLYPESLPGLSTSVYLMLGFCTSLLFFGSVLLHELSHSIVANRYGLGVKRITLFVFGGVAQLGQEPHTPAIEARVAAAGPVCSLSLALLFWLLSVVARQSLHAEMLSAVLEVSATVNVGLGVFNLIPGFPLDGGRLLRAGLWNRSRDVVAATKRASTGGKVVGMLLLAIGIVLLFFRQVVGGLWLFFIGLFLQQVAEASYQQTLVKAALAGKRVSDAMNRDFHFVSPATPIAAVADQYLVKHKSLALPVADGGEFLGFITYRNLKSVHKTQWETKTVGDLLVNQAEIPSASPEEPLMHVYTRMLSDTLPIMAVVDDGAVVAVLSRSDIMKVIRDRQRRQAVSGGNHED
jgi:Zn-dependent protease/predicted transcriptional regulator